MEYTGKYYFYSYINIYTDTLDMLAKKVLTHSNSICTGNHPIIVAKNYSVNGNRRIVNSWQEISKEEYFIFRDIITNEI